MRRIVQGIIAVALATILSPAHAQYEPPRHTQPTPPLGRSDEDMVVQANNGITIERGRTPQEDLAEHRRLDRALARLAPQRKGVIDVYVVAVGLDSDAVFGREAREAGRVLARRYGAEGRTIVLAGTDGRAASDLPRGSPGNIATVLARVAEVMDKREDVLILYTTSHGAPLGIIYNDGDQGFGAISPVRLAEMLETLGIRRRLVMISACYSGVFVPALASEDGVVITAASSDRTSFGCQADSDWTFFGDALINNALRKPQPLAEADREAVGLIAQWEARGNLVPSGPQIEIGARADKWLDVLDKRVPPVASKPVGRPAISLLDAR
ncbi:C13 family peptidase [Sphingomonas sp. MMS24-J45]|uniref:C13 family peptidase n=1 Tax=Sphingomonas sp. MMS24-J45 TaxID=3238806 RepID=UPI00384E8710